MDLVIHRFDQRQYGTVITRRDNVRFLVGGVFGSMTYLSGRSKPHADAHSHELLKANRAFVVEAEGLVAIFNNSFEVGHGPESPLLRDMLGNHAWTPPDARVREFSGAAIQAVWTAWHEMRAHWESLPIGERLRFVWSGERVHGTSESRQRQRERDRRRQRTPEPLMMHVSS